jgi:hypothetical protein
MFCSAANLQLTATIIITITDLVGQSVSDNRCGVRLFTPIKEMSLKPSGRVHVGHLKWKHLVVLCTFVCCRAAVAAETICVSLMADA